MGKKKNQKGKKKKSQTQKRVENKEKMCERVCRGDLGSRVISFQIHKHDTV